MPTGRWVKSGNTSGVLKSSSDWLNYTRLPGDVCVAFFNVSPGNKDALAPNPLTKEESRCVYKRDDECLSGSTKRTAIGYLTCQSNGLMGGPWPMKAAMSSRPSAVSLKIWLRKTN